jgi:hypothetical protein
MSSFSNKKALRFVITLGTGEQITLQGLRASVTISKAGGVQMNTMQAKIYGVSQSNMNAATSLQFQADTIKRTSISVFAIDGPQESLVFTGNIGNCWANYASMPDVYLDIQAFAGLINQLAGVPPTSLQGAVDTATVMGSLAKTMGYVFENNGVAVTLRSPYLPGTAWEQAQALAQQANCVIYLDDNVLAITPAGGARTGKSIPEISSSTGLVGYPSIGGDNRGPTINFQTLFNPAIRFGGQIHLTTSTQTAINKVLPRANGDWTVNSLSHLLQSETPGGAWFSTASCGLLGQVIIK